MSDTYKHYQNIAHELRVTCRDVMATAAFATRETESMHQLRLTSHPSEESCGLALMVSHCEPTLYLEEAMPTH